MAANPVRLGDVAHVYTWARKMCETIVRVNGREAVGLEIYKEGDANTVAACNLVEDLLGFERDQGLSFGEDPVQRIEGGQSRKAPAGEGPARYCGR